MKSCLMVFQDLNYLLFLCFLLFHIYWFFTATYKIFDNNLAFFTSKNMSTSFVMTCVSYINNLGLILPQQLFYKFLFKICLKKSLFFSYTISTFWCLSNYFICHYYFYWTNVISMFSTTWTISLYVL